MGTQFDDTGSGTNVAFDNARSFQSPSITTAVTNIGQAVINRLKKSGGTMTGALVLHSSSPSTSLEAASKGYVDSVAAGSDIHAAVRVATTSAKTLASEFENGDTIDGIVLATNDRILIKDQAAGAENGIYTVNASGAPTRATDADVTGEIVQGTQVFVSAGTANAGTTWTVTTAGTITIGSTSIAWTQTGAGVAAGSITSTHLSSSLLDASQDLDAGAAADTKVPTQLAVKTYVDGKVDSSTDLDGASASSTVAPSQSAVRTYARAVPQIGGLLIAHSTSSAEAQAAAYAVTTGANFVADVQAAINAIDSSSAGAGDVILAPMTLTGLAVGATGVKLKTGTGVRGAFHHSLATQLTLGSGTTYLFSLNDVNVHGCTVADLWVDGNAGSGGSGGLLSFDNTGGSFTGAPSTSPDPYHTISGIHAKNFTTGTRDGIVLSANTRVAHLQDCYLFNFSGAAYSLDCVDSHITDLHAGQGTPNFAVLGNNNRFIGCKAFYGNGTGGFEVSGQRNSFAKCEAQDEDNHGFYVTSGRNTFDVVADQCGRTGTGWGFYLTASRCDVNLITMQYETETTQDGGLYCSGNYNDLRVHATQMSNSGAIGAQLAADYNTLHVIAEGCHTGLALGTNRIANVTGVIRSSDAAHTLYTGTVDATNGFARLITRTSAGTAGKYHVN